MLKKDLNSVNDVKCSLNDTVLLNILRMFLFFLCNQLKNPLSNWLMNCSSKLKQLLAFTGFHLPRSRWDPIHFTLFEILRWTFSFKPPASPHFSFLSGKPAEPKGRNNVRSSGKNKKKRRRKKRKRSVRRGWRLRLPQRAIEVRWRRTRTETKRGTEVETETVTGLETGKESGRTTNAGMVTVDQEAAQLAVHAAEAIQKRGNAKGSQTIPETTLFHLPFTTCTLLQQRPNGGPIDVVSIPWKVTFFKAHLHSHAKGNHDSCSVFQSAVRLGRVNIFL